MLLREFRKKGLALQNKNREKKNDSYKGAYCFAEPGLYENLVILDFSALYPSIIQNANISPETLGGNDIKIPDSNITFSSNQKGIIPTIMEFMIEKRKKLKEKLKETNEEKYDIQQVAIKMNNINALYGMLSNSYSRIYNLQLAETVTAIGRNLIQYIKSRLENDKYQPVLIDTDSCFIPGINKKDNEMIENKVKKYISEFVEDNQLLSDFKFENQGNYEKIFIHAKKSYILYNPPDTYVIKGLGIIRGDTSDFQKEIDFSVMQGLLDGKTKRELNSIVNNKLKNIRNLPLEKIGFPKKINSNKNYKVKTIAARASEYTKKYIGELEFSDFFKILYISKSPSNVPNTNVIAIPADQNKIKDFTIDYELMKEKSISRIKEYITLGLEDFFKFGIDKNDLS
jgi:DNA polymerase I